MKSKLTLEERKERVRAAVRASYRKHRDKRRAYGKKWALENVDKLRKLKKSWNERNKDKCYEHAYRSQLKKYGLTEDSYAELLRNQNNVCAICHKECQVYRRLCVDHDHETGVVRGLLCNHCNSGLGKFFHDKNLLAKGIEYLNITIDPLLSRVVE
jgi:hypothetical protein